MPKCNEEMEIFSRVCGYFRPVRNFNKAKAQEFLERKKFDSFLKPNYDGRSIFEKTVMAERELLLKNKEERSFNAN